MRTDGRTLFYRTLPVEAGDPIKSLSIIMDVIYLTSTALGQKDFEVSFPGSKIWLNDSHVMLLYLKVK